MGRFLRWGRLGALAAGVGALLWAVKSVAILVTGDQPPLLFELAPGCFAAGVLLLALDLPLAAAGLGEDGGSRRRRLPGVVLAGAATVAGVAGAAGEAAGYRTAAGALLGVCVAGASAAAVVCARPWPWRWRGRRNPPGRPARPRLRDRPGAEALVVRRAAVGTALVLLPAFVLMGALAPFGEELIEIGLLVVAAAWGWLAVCMHRAAR